VVFECWRVLILNTKAIFIETNLINIITNILFKKNVYSVGILNRLYVNHNMCFFNNVYLYGKSDRKT